MTLIEFNLQYTLSSESSTVHNKVQWSFTRQAFYKTSIYWNSGSQEAGWLCCML